MTGVAPPDAAALDLGGAAHLADPYAGYRAIGTSPRYSPRWDVWFVGGYEACREVFARPEVFDDIGQPYLRGLQAAVLAGATTWRCPVVPPAVPNFVEQRREGRRTTGRALGTTFVDSLWPDFAAGCRATLDALIERAGDDPVDLVRSYAIPQATRLLAGLMGVGPADLPAFLAWAEGTYDGPPDEAEQRVVARGIRRVLAHQAVDRRRCPHDDFVGQLVANPGVHRTDGPPLTAHLEFVVSTGLMISRTTHQGLVLSFSTLLRALLEHPEQYRLLRSGPELLAGAVEEGLRYDSTTQALGRYVREPVVLSGVTIPAGSQLVLLTGVANRDPARWSGPDRFDITRDVATTARHLSFGHGISSCLGAAMSRRALGHLLAPLVERSAALTPAPGHAWFPEFMTRGLTALPVRLTPAP